MRSDYLFRHLPSGSIPQPPSEAGWAAGLHSPLGSIPQPSLVGAVQREARKDQSGSSRRVWPAPGVIRDVVRAAARSALRMRIVSCAAPARAFGGPRGPRLSLIMVLSD